MIAKNMEVPNQRILWADILKGIGIVSVVIGHIYGGMTHKLIFSFHMPLFFFVGGYFFKPQKSKIVYLKSQVRGLLLPYLSFLIVIYPIFFLPALIENWSINNLVIFLLKPILGGRWLVEQTSVFWFITCYFLTQQLFNLLVTKFNEKKLFLLVCLSLLMSYLNSFFFRDLLLPWNLNVVFGAISFFYAGWLIRSSNFELKKFILLIILVISIFLVYFIEGNSYDMKYANYGIPVLTLFCSVTIILFLKWVSELLSRFKYASLLLERIGKASLVIMYVHQPLKVLLWGSMIANRLFILTIVLVFSLCLYEVLGKSKFGKVFFLGSKR